MSRGASRLNQIPITLLGTQSQREHTDSLQAMLAGQVAGISSLFDSQAFRAGQPINWARRLRRFRDQLWGTSDPDYLKYALNVIDASQTQIVIGYWGTMPLPDLLAIKKARPHVKVVLLLLCYPLALTGSGIRRQDFFMRRAVRFLDGIIFSSEVMEEYVRERLGMRNTPASVIISPCWPSSFLSNRDLSPTTPNSRLIYVGRTDLSSKTIHVADDVRQLMSGILNARIELHHAESLEMNDGHPFRKPFPPRPMNSLIDWMSEFDGSLMAYNTKACARDDRFRMTIPDRLITSVVSGVPIVIPKQGYPAAKNYLKQYPAIIEFDSPAELAEILSDRAHVDSVRRAAWNARHNYLADTHGPKLAEFLGRLL